MNTYLFFDPRARPLTDAGDILPAAKLQFYLTDTTTPSPVYSDAELNTELPNPVIADDAGRFPAIYMDPEVTYRVQLLDSDDVLQWDIDPYTPPRDYAPGTILMFYGSAEARDAAYPTALWQVCDGSNGSPDMRDRFPVGVSGSKAVGSTGGGSYNTATGEGGGVSAGNTGSTVLTEANMPVHGHRLYVRTSSSLIGNTRGFGNPATAGLEGQISDNGPFGYVEDSPADGDPLVEPTGTEEASGHTHTVPAISAHTHTFEQKDPPYLALWFLMRKAA